MTKKTIIMSVSILVVLIAVGAWYVFVPHGWDFCFNFEHNMAYGDREVKNPVNQGIVGGRGIVYYLPEVPALQMALKEEGFYIDDYEATGGGVYYAAFFGPSTQVAVRDFQKKYNLPQTGQVDDATSDKLRALYGCPAAPVSKTASSTPATATTSPVR